MNKIKINIDDLKNMVQEAVLRSASWHYVFKGMENLGFDRELTANDYEGNSLWHIVIFNIPKERYTPEIEEKVKALLNRCGWMIFKKSNNHYDFYGRGPFVSIHIESVRGEEANGDNVFFHATPKNRVKKILRNGLCPRDEGKRGEFRGARIYLSIDNNRWLFNQLFDNSDYEVLMVDLRGSGIKVYEDEYAQGGFYTLENIPPSRLKITKNPQKEIEDKRKRFVQMANDALYGLNFNINERKIKGVANGVEFIFDLNLFGGVTYTGKPYEIRMYRRSKRRYETCVGFNDPEEAVKWIVKQIKKVA